MLVPTERTSDPCALELVVWVVAVVVVLLVELPVLEELVVELVDAVVELLVVLALLVVLVVEEVVLLVVLEVVLLLLVVVLEVELEPEYVEPLKVKRYAVMSVAEWSPGEENSPTANPSWIVVPTPSFEKSN